jgi:hypothetical protein
MFENKAISPTTAFLFKNHCKLLHEFKHPLQRCFFFFVVLLSELSDEEVDPQEQ